MGKSCQKDKQKGLVFRKYLYFISCETNKICITRKRYPGMVGWYCLGMAEGEGMDQEGKDTKAGDQCGILELLSEAAG